MVDAMKQRRTWGTRHLLVSEAVFFAQFREIFT
jgi:hypothetical protein